MSLNKHDLYRFPWSLNDNPIGWLEVTDICNIECKGCYRQQVTGHKPIEQIKEEVALLKRWRNCDNITIAGGDPLIHAGIVDIVKTVAASGLKPFILTNGVKASVELLRELKDAGLIGIGFHVDSLQKRAHWKGEKEEIALCTLRQEYADRVAEAGLPPAGFGMTVYRENIQLIPEVIRWALKNRGKVGGLSFICYRGARTEGWDYFVGGKKVKLADDTLGYMTQDAPQDIGIESKDVYHVIKDAFPRFEASAYLGGTQRKDSFKWLDGYMLCADTEILGSLGRRSMELLQTAYHTVYGRYFVYLKGKAPATPGLLLALIDPTVRRATLNYLRDPFHKVWGLSIAIVQAPDLLADGRIDMCDSCPDMTIHNGELVHSCRLDEYRKFGQLVSAAPRPETAKGASATPARA